MEKKQAVRAFASSGAVPRSPAKPRVTLSFAVRLLLPLLSLSTLGGAAVLPVNLLLSAFERFGFGGAAALAVPALHLFAVSTIGVAIIFKWIAIGRLRPGMYAIHSLPFIRWWALDHTLGILRRVVLKPVYGCSPFILRAVARSLGAVVGPASGAADLINGGVDLMRVGAHVVLHGEAHAALVVDGMLLVAPVALGSHVQVGDLTMIGPGTVVGSGSLISPGSALGAGCHVPPEVRVSGVPAQVIGHAPPPRALCRSGSLARLAAGIFGAVVAPAFFLARYAVLAAVYQALLHSGLATPLQLATPPDVLNNYFIYQLSHWTATAFGWMVVIIAKWSLLGRLYDGQVLTPSLTLRRWMVDTLLHLHLDAPFFCRGATNTGAIMPTVMRLLGQRVDPGYVVNYRFYILRGYDLLEIGPGTFFGMSTHCVFDEIDEEGRVVLRAIRAQGSNYVGMRGMVLAPSTLHVGATVAGNSVLHRATVAKGAVHIGRPAREVSRSPGTHRHVPPSGVDFFRLLMHFFGDFVFAINAIATACTFVAHRSVMGVLQATCGASVLAASACAWSFVPLAYLGSAAVVQIGFQLICASGWTEGRRDTRFPLSSVAGVCWFLQAECCTALNDWCDLLSGTPWQTTLLNCMGARISHRAFFAANNVYEPSLIAVEADAAVSRDVFLIPHSWEIDGHVTCKPITLRSSSAMLPGTILHGGITLPPSYLLGFLSRPLSGQELIAGTEGAGVPVRRVDVGLGDGLPVPARGTVLEMGHRTQAATPSKQLFSWVDHQGIVEASYTCSDFQSRSMRLAHALRFACCLPLGSRVLLCFPPGLEFIEAFYGCLHAGVIAVPIYPPSPSRLVEGMDSLQRIASSAQAVDVLTTWAFHVRFKLAQGSGLGAKLAGSSNKTGVLRWHVIDSLADAAIPFTEPSLTPHSLAFLQYSSGSTGAPKGVMVTHGALLNQVLYNTAAHAAAKDGGMGLTDDDVYAGWLPTYHDLGLICGFVMIHAVGASGHYMSPLSFLRSPATFAQLIRKQRVTLIAMPNFGYSYMVRRANDEGDVAPLLSLRMAMVGAEHTHRPTVEQWQLKFGVHPDVVSSGFGMAESVLHICGNGRVANEVRGRVSVGIPREPVVLRIVDPKSRRVLPRMEEGEIWVDTPSKCAGYWQQPELSATTFQARLAMKDDDGREYLRTGDLGFLDTAGELHISGRMKTLIILNGRNFYPQDFEATITREFEAFVRTGCVCAFGAEVDGAERLVIVAEAKETSSEKMPSDLLARIKRTIEVAHRDATLHSLVLIRARTLPKTTSGKLAPWRVRQAWAADASARLDVVARADWPTVMIGGISSFDPEASAVGAWVDTFDATLEVSRTREIVDHLTHHVSKYRCPAYFGDWALRGAHGRSHGVVHCDLRVLPLPAQVPALPLGLEGFMAGGGVGSASTGQPLHALIRFSASGDAEAELNIAHDRQPLQLHGASLKIVKDGCTLHDMTLINTPTLAGTNPKDALPENFARLPKATQLRLRSIERIDKEALLLDQAYWSCSAYSWGAAACRFQLRPASPLVVQLEEQLPAPQLAELSAAIEEARQEPLFQSLLLTRIAAAARVKLELCVQLPGANDPVDDETVPWGSPFHPIAEVMTTVQQIAPWRQGECDGADEALEFNPWSVSSAAHLPLGALNRARLFGYRASSAVRAHLNKLPQSLPYRPPPDMCVTIVGGGVSGLSAALALSEFGYHVVVLEKAARLGGHADSQTTGGHRRNPAFGAFQQQQWPNAFALMSTIGVPKKALGASVGFTGLYRHDGKAVPVEQIEQEAARFLRDAVGLREDPAADGVTLREWLAANHYSHEFVCYQLVRTVILFAGHSLDYYLDYPARLVAWMYTGQVATAYDEVYRVDNQQYMDCFRSALLQRGVRIVTGVDASVVGRGHDGLSLRVVKNSTSVGGACPLSNLAFGADGTALLECGQLILSTAPHQALATLGAHASPDETRTLSQFEQRSSTVLVHTDYTLLPTARAEWKRINYLFPDDGRLPSTHETIPISTVLECDDDHKTPTVATYCYDAKRAASLSLNGVVGRYTYEHVTVNPKCQELRLALKDLQGQRGVHYSGAWTAGLTLHEDAVASGLHAANQILAPSRSYPILERAVPLPPPFERVVSGASTKGKGPRAPETEQEALELLTSLLAEVLGTPAEGIQSETQLPDLGLASVQIARLINLVGRAVPVVGIEDVLVDRILSSTSATVGSVSSEILGVLREAQAESSSE